MKLDWYDAQYVGEQAKIMKEKLGKGYYDFFIKLKKLDDEINSDIANNNIDKESYLYYKEKCKNITEIIKNRKFESSFSYMLANKKDFGLENYSDLHEDFLENFKILLKKFKKYFEKLKNKFEQN